MPVILDNDDIDFGAYMRDTDAQQKVRSPRHWQDDLIAEFADHGRGIAHPRMPWPKLDGKVALRPGEVSLWFGFNGHGKSLLVGQVMLSLVAQLQRSCIASFEMKPRKTLARMARQWADAEAPAPSQLRDFIGACDGNLWLYDQVGTVEPARIYAVMRYCADKLKVQHFVIDNLTKCIASDDDYTGQKSVVDKLTALAQELDIHVHLVHHARKGQDETRPPRKMDALGASAITNLVDNVFVVWRNKAKYEAAEIDDSKPDALLICDKQRHGTGWEGALKLQYHARSQQHIERGTCAMDMAFWPHDGAAP